MIDYLANLWNSHGDNFFEILRRLIICVIIILICFVVGKGLTRLIRRASKSRHVNDTICSMLRHIVSYGITIICIIMVLNVFDINTSSLLALLGAAGLAIGLALRDTLGNIASSIILFFLGSYRIGEFIEFGSLSGTVKEIGLFTTILETPDGIFISAPNSGIWGSPVRNFSRNGRRRMEITIRVAYTDSIEKAISLLNEIIISEPRFLKEPPYQIVVQSFQESYVNVGFRAWAENGDYWDIYWKIMRSLKEKIEEAGLKIPFGQQEIHLIENKKAA